MELIPYIYFFLLLDRVTHCDLNPGIESIRGFKNISINEPFFQVHFPSTPVIPGLLIQEGVAKLSTRAYIDDLLTFEVEILIAQHS